jgi:hypothetical protein
MKMTSSEAHLVRNYNRRLSSEAMKKRFINSAVTLSLYMHGENSENPLQDAFEAVMSMNDNDIYMARRYKTKKLRQLNPDELAEVFESDYVHRFALVDEDGNIYDYDTIKRMGMQGGNDFEYPPDF